jgi:hypothetical protein
MLHKRTTHSNFRKIELVVVQNKTGDMAMTPSQKSLSQILQIEGNQEHYLIPKYQRPYKWGRDNWEDLLRDIDEDANHFMGSIICVPRTNESSAPGEEKLFELIDGQQRLTTLSLLLCAIYGKLEELKPGKGESESSQSDFLLLRSSVGKKLVKEKPLDQLSPNDDPVEKTKKVASFIRLCPSSQSQNFADYLYALTEVGLLREGAWPANWGNRRVGKCLAYFREHIASDARGLGVLIDRINNLRFIHISVPSQSDAYRLFEALNNRGQPLSALDIIKNGLLARIERRKRGSIDDAFEKWKTVTDRLTEDEAVQERYLRHFYHAFKHRPEIGVKAIPRATRSTVINIYDELAKKDAEALLNNLVEGSQFYQMLVDPARAKLTTKRRSIFVELDRIGAAPAYQGLLYFLDAEKNGHLESTGTLDDIADFLARYFVRRNITDEPGTNRLDAIFGSLIDACQSEIKAKRRISAEFIVGQLRNNKSDKPADDETFRKWLLDSLWAYNDGMARYVLCRLDESFKSREYAPDLWRRDERGRFVWTVEHVLPQTENLRKEWIEMIASGNSELALEVQEKWVDCLGNLTLSGYNSKLSDKPFPQKQESNEITVAGDRINVGYKNGLALNNISFSIKGKGKSRGITLATTKSWGAAEIESRNEAIVDRLMKMFML